MKRIKSFICFALSALLLLTACSVKSSEGTAPETSHQLPVISASSKPSFDDNDLFVQKAENGTITFSGDVKASGRGVSVNGSAATIFEEGVYRVSGTSSDGQIIVDCSKKDDVTLIFDDLSLNCIDGPALWCLEADTLTVSLPQGSTSSLSDGSSRSDKDNPDAAIYSKGDLYFNGTGSLSVAGCCNNAIESKDSLTILECSLSVNADDDGIIGKDSVEIGFGASVSVDCKGDGIRSTNKKDEGRGNIYLDKCTVKISSGADAVQAASSLIIDNGAVLSIVSGGGAKGISSASENHDNNDMQNTDSTSNKSSSSQKGLKAADTIFIMGGTVDADCADDAVHSNGEIIIYGGVLKLSSDDDGLHADSALTLSGGELTVSRSYEGIEANVINVSGGKSDITATDDGINVAGGNDSSSADGMWGHDIFAEDEACLLSISGGYLHVNAFGDGVDSNGSVKMSGGELYISGPVDNDNGFLDFDDNFEITGGTFLAAGSSSMARSADAGTQASVFACFDKTVLSGSVISLKTSDGTEIISYEVPKSCQCFAASSPIMSEGETVEVYIDGESACSLTASVRLKGKP